MDAKHNISLYVIQKKENKKGSECHESSGLVNFLSLKYHAAINLFKPEGGPLWTYIASKVIGHTLPMHSGAGKRKVKPQKANKSEQVFI